MPTKQQQTQFVPLSFLTTQSTDNDEFIPTMVIRVGHAAIELSSQVQPELLASVLKVLNDALIMHLVLIRFISLRVIQI